MLMPAASSLPAAPRRGLRHRLLFVESAIDGLRTEVLQASVSELSLEIERNVTRGAQQVEGASRRERRALARGAREDNLGLGHLDAWPSLPEGAESDPDALTRLLSALEAGRLRSRSGTSAAHSARRFGSSLNRGAVEARSSSADASRRASPQHCRRRAGASIPRRRPTRK
jgi:hypothetical protein